MSETIGSARIAFPLVAVTLLLGGSFNRRGQMLRILIAVAIVVAAQVFVLSMKSLGEKVPQVEAFVYLTPIALIGVFSYLLRFSRPRRRKRSALAGVGDAS